MRALTLVEPGVELVLEVELVREHAARLEVGLRVALQPLDRALGLRIAASQNRQPTRSCPQNAANASVGRPPWPWMPAWRSQTSVFGNAAQPRQAARDPGQQILGLLGEHQHAGAGARVAQARDDHPAPARLAVTDRDLRPRLPDIELADLARPVDGALKRPARRREQRPNLAQIVIDDRLARPAAQRLQQLTDPDPGQLGILAQQPVDLVFERLQHARLRRPLIARRPLARSARRTVLRDSPVARASSLIDLPPTKCSRRSSAHCSTSTTPQPPLSSHRPTRLSTTPDGSATRPRGSVFVRRRGSVFTRRRQRATAAVAGERFIRPLTTCERVGPFAFECHGAEFRDWRRALDAMPDPAGRNTLEGSPRRHADSDECATPVHALLLPRPAHPFSALAEPRLSRPVDALGRNP